MIAYFKLFDLLNRKGMKKTDLIPLISGPTLAKMGNNYSVGIEVINRLCEILDCQPGDITEYIPGEQPTPKNKSTKKKPTINTVSNLDELSERDKELLKYLDGETDEFPQKNEPV